MRLHKAASTDTGRVRAGNEDALFCGDSVFAVADGMGGHAGGEIASELAVEPIASLDGKVFSTSHEAVVAVRTAIADANGRILAKAESDPTLAGMGTTLTVALVEGRKAHVAHVGDSRAYLLRDGSFHQLTRDHTVVQLMVESGELDAEDAGDHPQRSMITRALGIEGHVETDVLSLDLLPDDQLLLCSDGLSGLVDDEVVARELLAERSANETVTRLIGLANDAGGTDNITIVLLRTEADGSETRLEPAGSGTQLLDRLPAPSGQEADSSLDGRLAGLRAWVRRNVALVIIAAIGATAVLTSTYVVIANSYFVGVNGEAVAVYRGLSAQIGPVELFSLVQTSDVRIDDLPVTARENVLDDGIRANSLEDAELIIENFSRLAADANAPRETP